MSLDFEKLLKEKEHWGYIKNYATYGIEVITTNDVREILNQALKTQQAEILEKLKKRIMKNGNLSNRIIEDNDGNFEHKHDYVLNNIVCKIIEEELTNQSQQNKNSVREVLVSHDTSNIDANKDGCNVGVKQTETGSVGTQIQDELNKDYKEQ